MTACGLDFGTSNTTLGVARGDGPVLCALEGGESTLPSAIFFDREGARRLGRAAIDAYVEGVEGRLMSGLKSVLGSSLIDEKTQIGARRVAFRHVIGAYMQGVKEQAEGCLGHELTSVVHGRPVHFVDGDAAADRRAEDALRVIAHEIGFRDVCFQFEPIAAALDYEQHIDAEQVALIADIGGGTSDFSIVRLSPDRRRRVERGEDILANDGVHIGGTDFDRVLALRSVTPLLGHNSPMKRADLNVPSSYFHDIATWHRINRLYDPKVLTEVRQVRRDAARPELIDRLIRAIEERRGHALVGAVEKAKIRLASNPRTRLALDWMGPDVAVDISAEDLAERTGALASRISGRIASCLALAGLRAGDIDALFLTGGSTRLAHVRRAIIGELPHARVIEGDTFGSVGIGLSIEAGRRFGPAGGRAAAPATRGDGRLPGTARSR
ncbi:Hsp70 family protein [Ancylobacter sp. TS-1]|uniref:Hsp70 family protein n=1 Tax=Ancylobacter sp. TS-1 TaxID=1850374 RepID=UPI001265B63E|nr:Hsp70 family protein [Ancylobacter sp. TS-1]QFR32657.1 Hsp70 family protein [Ancylobacter sp. TS-1]